MRTLLFSLLFSVVILFPVATRADCDDPDEDTNLVGYDVPNSSKKVSDWFECCQLCSDTPTCVAWTFSNDDGTCSPKTSTDGATAGLNMLSGRIISADQPPAQAVDDPQELVGDEAAAQAVTDVVQEFTPDELQAMAHEDDVQALAVEDTAELLGDESEFTDDEVQAFAVDDTAEFLGDESEFTDDEVQAFAVDDTAEFLGDESEFTDDEVQAFAVDDTAEFFGDEAHVADDAFFFGDEAYYGDEAQADATGTYQSSSQGMAPASAVGIFVAVVLFVSLFVIGFAVYIIRQEKAPAELI